MSLKIKLDFLVKAFIATAVLGPALSYSKLYLFHIALIIAILSFLHVRKFRIVRLNTHYHWIFYCMFTWYFLSVLWSYNKLFSFQYLFYLFCGISIVMIIVYFANTIDKLEDIFMVLMVFFIAEIIIALLESLSILRLPVSPYSNIVHFFGRESTLPGFPAHLQFLFKHTPTGFNWNQNNLAFVMNLILPFFLFAKRNWLKIFGALAIYFIIFKTQSRGNIIAYFVMLAIFVLFINRYKWLFRGLSVLLLIISLVVGLNLARFEASAVGEAIGSVSALITGEVQEKNSIGLRQRYIKNGLDALKDTYGLGVGAGNSGNAEFHEDVSEGSSKISMHNFWIEILIDGGILFAIVFYSWYGYTIFTLFRISQVTPETTDIKYFSRASALSLVGFLFGAISASSVIYDLPMWILFGFSIAVINIYKTEKSDLILQPKKQIS